MRVVSAQDADEAAVQEAVQLLNATWPRSDGARRSALQRSKETLPLSLLLVAEEKDAESNGLRPGQVVAHAKISEALEIPTAVLFESVIVCETLRGIGLGRQIMCAAEDFARSRGYKHAYLSTTDKQAFYQHLGYTETDVCVSGLTDALRRVRQSLKQTTIDPSQDDPQTQHSHEAPASPQPAHKPPPPPPPPPPSAPLVPPPPLPPPSVADKPTWLVKRL
ncbi:hypothetical protein PTSG_02805 [Salpingoeca rosetta]|uniref:N-acetyltransferase domain-containing protein n=1 Tax=Salpingoeca rosetta (strain ATCC 50818 / BSB-021) TaxID=946362 RepID=F2U3D7_SALR5|nr:uncharacterized protein PTSG_02805 [Salpingoeca rosetta]EGD82131.1 hypothetical protein PTSG_02805 [Salpingoeca rosetta]|eukprot:XP_004996314.1 hypothetical protein PTSG_02805 [Salpingoeca rosetta]